MKREITVLDPSTIDKIAAGEVVERPESIAKELLENAIDAGASAVTLEIREGGIDYLRVTDNGTGIPRKQIRLAFARHATSKIRALEDLSALSSLGFRGEALSSIAAVSRVECVTRTAEDDAATLIRIEGGAETEYTETGASAGTTIIVRDLFYNTPARAKFLKSAVTEGNKVADAVEALALSCPEISFRFILNGKEKLFTSGNGDKKELVYNIFGRDIAQALLPVDHESQGIRVGGYIAAPPVSRGNRSYENYFVNGRWIRDTLVARAVEEAYRGHLMQHRYPFALLYLEMSGEEVDINVHPAKREVRFAASNSVFSAVNGAVKQALSSREVIPDFGFAAEVAEETEETPREPAYMPDASPDAEEARYFIREETEGEQLRFLSEEARKEHRIIGQIFDTYWILQYRDELYIVDQHAAHEKVLYERLLAKYRNKELHTQVLSPAIVIRPGRAEAEILERHLSDFAKMGFVIEPFGGESYKISEVPMDLYSLSGETMFRWMLDEMDELEGAKPQGLTDRIAMMACKAAVKGNTGLSRFEAEYLIDELLDLEEPYHCPHGRPTIISLSRSEIERRFGRLV